MHKWSSFGNLKQVKPWLTVDDKKAVDMWEQSIELVNGHYQMDIPFKSKNPYFPDNPVIAEKRLR